MSGTNLARLFLRGGIWGSSVMLMRVASPALGPLMMAFGRILLGLFDQVRTLLRPAAVEP